MHVFFVTRIFIISICSYSALQIFRIPPSRRTKNVLILLRRGVFFLLNLFIIFVSRSDVLLWAYRIYNSARIRQVFASSPVVKQPFQCERKSPKERTAKLPDDFRAFREPETLRNTSRRSGRVTRLSRSAIVINSPASPFGNNGFAVASEHGRTMNNGLVDIRDPSFLSVVVTDERLFYRRARQ